MWLILLKVDLIATKICTKVDLFSTLICNPLISKEKNFEKSCLIACFLGKLGEGGEKFGRFLRCFGEF